MMFDVYTVTFFGHRYVDQIVKIEYALEDIIGKLLREQEYVEFLLGRDGEFDLIVASCVKKCQKRIRDDNSSMTWVLPYSTAELSNNMKEYEDYYDSIEICEEASRSHPKAAITKRNQSMIDRSDLVICYVEHESGGAYKAMKYAEKAGKTVINIADHSNEN